MEKWALSGWTPPRALPATHAPYTNTRGGRAMDAMLKFLVGKVRLYQNLLLRCS